MAASLAAVGSPPAAIPTVNVVAAILPAPSVADIVTVASPAVAAASPATVRCSVVETALAPTFTLPFVNCELTPTGSPDTARFTFPTLPPYGVIVAYTSRAPPGSNIMEWAETETDSEVLGATAHIAMPSGP